MPDDAETPQPSLPADTSAILYGDKWGELPTPERQHSLLDQLAAWDAKTDHGGRRNPFDGDDHRLTGADVFFLAAHVLVGTNPNFPDLAAAQASLLAPRTGNSMGIVFNPFNLANLHLETLYVNTFDDYREVTPRSCLVDWD
jgi:hypothetical protein